MLRIILTIVVTALLLGSAVSQQKIGSSGINETMLKAHIKFLADDSFDEGSHIDKLLRDPKVARDLGSGEA